MYVNTSRETLNGSSFLWSICLPVHLVNLLSVVHIYRTRTKQNIKTAVFLSTQIQASPEPGARETLYLLQNNNNINPPVQSIVAIPNSLAMQRAKLNTVSAHS